MIKKDAKIEIQNFSTEEVKVTYIHSKENEVGVMLPYSTSEFNIEIDGETTEDQVNDFVEKVNLELEEMAMHLQDCKL